MLRACYTDVTRVYVNFLDVFYFSCSAPAVAEQTASAVCAMQSHGNRLKNNDKNRDKNRDKNKDKNKNKEKRIEIEKASLDSADDEERSGRDDIGSPVGSTGSQLLPQNSEDTEVESQTGKPRESDQLQSPTVAGSHDGNNIFGSDPGPSVGTAGRNDFLDFEFDSEKYVTGLKMPPISFNMTVSELTSTIDTDELKPHFKAFFEDILGMRSNEDWYPLHSKSMHNISLKLFPSKPQAQS